MSRDHWTRLLFSKAVDINPKRAIKKGEKAPFVEMAALPTSGSKIQYLERRVITSGGSRFQNGDTLFARITPCAENGKIGFVDCLPEGVTGAGSTEFIVFGPRDGLTVPEFVYHLARSKIIRKPALSRMIGTTGRQRIPNSVFDEIEVLLPPLHEQRRIAEVLSSVDEAIQATQAVIEQTRKVKQAVLKRLLTNGIGHTRFKLTEIGEIPEDWEVVSLADLAENSRNSFVIGPFGSDLVMSDYRDEGVPVVFVRDVRPGQFKWKSNVFVSEEKASQLQAHSVKPDDIMVTKMGLPPGIAALCPGNFLRGIVTADIIRLRPDRTKVDPAFLVELLNGDRARKAVEEITGGQTRPKITLRDYKSIKIALPRLPEQRLIREGIAPFQADIESQEEQITVLQTLKKALMSDLLTGRKRVSTNLPIAAE